MRPYDVTHAMKLTGEAQVRQKEQGLGPFWVATPSMFGAWLPENWDSPLPVMYMGVDLVMPGNCDNPEFREHIPLAADSTWWTLFSAINRGMHEAGDLHHIYVESINVKTTESGEVMTLELGS